MRTLTLISYQISGRLATLSRVATAKLANSRADRLMDRSTLRQSISPRKHAARPDSATVQQDEGLPQLPWSAQTNLFTRARPGTGTFGQPGKLPTRRAAPLAGRKTVVAAYYALRTPETRPCVSIIHYHRWS